MFWSSHLALRRYFEKVVRLLQMMKKLFFSKMPATPVTVVMALLLGLSLMLGSATRMKAGEADRNGGFEWASAFFDYPYRLAPQTGPVLQVVTQEYQPALK